MFPINHLLEQHLMGVLNRFRRWIRQSRYDYSANVSWIFSPVLPTCNAFLSFLWARLVIKWKYMLPVTCIVFRQAVKATCSFYTRYLRQTRHGIFAFHLKKVTFNTWQLKPFSNNLENRSQHFTFFFNKETPLEFHFLTPDSGWMIRTLFSPQLEVFKLDLTPSTVNANFSQIKSVRIIRIIILFV